MGASLMEIMMKRRRGIPRRSERRGFYMIGMLIVLAIIFIVMGRGYFAQDPLTGVTQAQVYTERTRDSTCALNAQAMKTNITQQIAMNNGQLPSIHVLKVKMVNMPHCPGDGVYEIDKRGDVFCTKHNPAAEFADVITLEP